MPTMIDALLLQALAAGLMLALAAGPLSCVVSWSRLAYFGDAVAHGALLGVVFALMINMETGPWIAVAALAQAGLLYALNKRGLLGSDTLLGVVSHGALALAMVLLSWKGQAVDAQAYLFGDILAVTWTDVAALGVFALLSGAWLKRVWPGLTLAALNADMAQVEGVNVARLRLCVMLIIALLVALSLKITGALLATSLLVLPAAGARPFARTPGGMAVVAVFGALMGVVLGMLAAFMFDLPIGPCVVLALIGWFAVGAFKR